MGMPQLVMSLVSGVKGMYPKDTLPGKESPTSRTDIVVVDLEIFGDVSGFGVVERLRKYERSRG